MTTTYSLAITGASAGQAFGVKNRTLPDDTVPLGTTATMTTATVGGRANAMAHNTPMLCQRPDGSQGWYTLDAERSTDANPVLRRV